MGKLFKNLKPYWKSVLVIFVLLVVQAFCDLSLPQYTSDIIDTGIQNSGVAHILPEKITAEEFDNAQLFMTEEEQNQWQDAYDGENRKDSLSEKKLDELDSDLLVPVLLLARLIFAYRLYSVDPVLANYYLELLGLMLLILASYRLSGFAVQAGGPRMFGFYADLTAILAVTLLADGHSAALLPLGGAAALEGFQRAMRMSDIAEKKTEE